MTTSPDRERMLRRRHKHERQAVIFGSIAAALAVASLGAVAVYSGTLSVPMLDREFTTPDVEDVAAMPDPPCPPEGTLPVAYNVIQVNVLNGSGREGLAGTTSTALTTRGFAVLSTGNYPASISSPVQIGFGEAGLAAAYTLAAQFDTPQLLLDTRVDATVDLVLGEDFTDLLDPTLITIDPVAPLVGVPGCVALETALADAVPGPTPTPTVNPDEEFQDGGEGFPTETPAPPAEG
ncbi:LytR C-terminal domain-containing protein [Cellulomonas sp. KRMCY2]|uniref:LytR C-terminal domain-containing protein n=1 Tax=Cellulomonas sp. KRMCY2 TaxID=1304865 RepID=UPI00045EA5E0|nr:LytR C-terminal domain-containing protein [Cellulomonas sp. KRMCY2]